TYARRVSLGDAEDETCCGRSCAAARGGGPGDCVGRRDERVGAVVDVEQDALRALEQDALAIAFGLVEFAPNGPRKLQHEIRYLGEVALEPFTIDRRFSETGAKR